MKKQINYKTHFLKSCEWRMYKIYLCLISVYVFYSLFIILSVYKMSGHYYI